jgi:hypothetical protein
MKGLGLVTMFAFTACSSPVNYSAPVGIELNAKSGDVNMSVVSEEKDITTESGNPYGAFVNTAMSKLGGKNPSQIDIDTLTLTLGAQSQGVTTLDQVVTGDVDVAFLVNSSNNTYDAGHITNPTGVGPDDVDATFDWSMVAPQDIPQMLNGSFKVVLRGSGATGFSGKGATASMQLTFTFSAFE